MEALIVVLVIVGFIGLAVFAAAQEKKRREALVALAARLSLRFNPERDYGLGARYGFLNGLAAGDNRYAFNAFVGAYQGNNLTVFEYHYETHSRDSKGRRHTHHHYLSVYTLALPAVFPELLIAPEGIFSKLAQALGYDDIDFESHEFSRSFCVRSRDKKFAYDVCHARMMEYLLANKDLTIEIEGSALAFVFRNRFTPEMLEKNMGRLAEVRGLLPEYLFSAK